MEEIIMSGLIVLILVGFMFLICLACIAINKLDEMNGYLKTIWTHVSYLRNLKDIEELKNNAN